MVLGGDGLNTGGGGGGTGGGIYCARACWIRPQALNITAHPPNDNWVRADRLSLLIGIVAPFEPVGTRLISNNSGSLAKFAAMPRLDHIY